MGVRKHFKCQVERKVVKWSGKSQRDNKASQRETAEQLILRRSSPTMVHHHLSCVAHLLGSLNYWYDLCPSCDDPV